MRSTIRLALAALIAFVFGCGSSPGSEEPKVIVLPDGTEVLDPPPPAGGQQLTSQTFTVPKGEEKYFCYTFHSPEDAVRAITEVAPNAPKVVHHEVLFQTIVDEPDGFFECPILVKVSWRPIWAGGAGARGLPLPPGVAFKVAPRTQYLVQYHLLNVTDHDITSRAAINLTYAPDATLFEAAGLFALGSFNFEIPATVQDHRLEVHCRSSKLLKVFAAFPHMHQLGKRLTFESGTSSASASMKYQISPWVFGDQPMEPVDFEVQPGDFMRATCAWDNPYPRAVPYGESTHDEMCFMVLFYHPFEDLDGCID